MCSEQGLSSEEGGLQHVCRLYDQHVLQPAQVLKLQSLIRLKGQSGRNVRKVQREVKEEEGEMTGREEAEGEGKSLKTETEGRESYLTKPAKFEIEIYSRK